MGLELIPPCIPIRGMLEKSPQWIMTVPVSLAALYQTMLAEVRDMILWDHGSFLGFLMKG